MINQDTVEKMKDKLYNYCTENNIKTLVTGISGGLDSAVVFALGSLVENMSEGKIENYGIMLPCKTSSNQKDYEDSINRGYLVFDKYGYEPKMMDISGIYNTFVDLFNNNFATDKENKISYGNIAARIRMITLYFLANQTKGMVMSTDNLSEYHLGFWTKHGDEGDFGPIQNLWKGTEVIELARLLEVPEEIIEANPTDGLGVTNGGDAAQIGTSYLYADEIMTMLMASGFDFNGTMLQNIPAVFSAHFRGKHDDKLVVKIAERCVKNSFKRKGCVNLTREELGLENRKWDAQ
jgi:NAD+ synthase